MSPSAKPTVDVLLPVWNADATIRSSIASIQAQTLRDLSIVVVDDGSTDNTAAILKEIASSDHRVRIVRTANGGLVEALNTGLSHCTAEFIARHDADDLSRPERLERQLAYMRANSDCVAVSTWAEVIDGDGQPTGGVAAHPSPDGADASRAPAREPFLMHPFLMVRHEAMQQAGGYRYAFHAEDADLYWRLREFGRLHIIPELLGFYRVHATSITGRSVLNGRISAANSQLAALSSLRRASARSDIKFRRDALRRYEDAKTLRGIFDVASEQLDDRERGLFKLSLAAQLMMLASLRPYELDVGDARFIRDAMDGAECFITRANLVEFRASVGATAGRLIAKGQLPVVAALTPPMLYPAVAVWLLNKASRRFTKIACFRGGVP